MYCDHMYIHENAGLSGCLIMMAKSLLMQGIIAWSVGICTASDKDIICWNHVFH